MKRYLTVVLLLCLSVLSVAQQPQTAPPQGKKQITIEAMFAPGGLMTAGPQGLQWSPDGTKVAYIQRGAAGEQMSLYYIDAATGKTAVLVASDKIAAMRPPEPQAKGDDRQRDNRARYGVAAFHWAPDSKGLLFDSMGHLWLYNLDTGKSIQLTNSPETSGDPKFSADGNNISFVRKHNLFVKPTGAAPEKQLTKDTDENLFNGEVDWVYSEELAVRSNYFWSPDSKQILFLQMNETKVPTYPIVDWIPTHPTTDMMKYPKAGDPNPTVRLGVLDLNGKTKWLELTSETDMYIPRFGWVKPGLAWAMVLNRLQNKQDLYLIDVATGKSKIVLSETDPAYIEITDKVEFLKSGDRFIWPSWRDGHTHLYLYSFDKANPLGSEAKLVNQITKGDWEVSQLEGVDETAGVVYFSANKDDARQVQLYSIKLDGSALAQLTKQPGNHRAEMSENTKYFVDNYSSLMTMPKLQICKSAGPCNDVWTASGMEQYDLLTPEFVDFKAEDGTVLHGVILLPKDGPGVVNGKVPLIMNPYGGPHGISVRDAYGVMSPFDQLLAKQGIAVLKVDNRGMGSRGRKFATVTYKHLYDIELKDQIDALKQAMQKYPQIDSTRLGWWGWSYGGSMTVYALTHSDMFKAGVSVAPVTDWHNYDSIYTERYMSLPKLNEEGYKVSNISDAAKNLHGSLLLVHGTSDDNVHMQNSIQFVNALINAGKQYDFLLYPRKTHGISGFQARTHLYHRILSHFQEAFLPKPQ